MLHCAFGLLRHLDHVSYEGPRTMHQLIYLPMHRSILDRVYVDTPIAGCDISTLAHLPRQVSKVSGERKSLITRPFGEYNFRCQEIITILK